MAQSASLRWLDGHGWLVFSGSVIEGSEVRAQALSRLAADGAVAYISLADDGGDALLDDMEDLGAPTGYIVDIQHEPLPVILEQLKDVSMVVIEGSNSINALRQLLSVEALAGVRDAYERGAIVLLEGLTMNLFGKWFMSDEGDIFEGLAWLEDAFLEPNVTSVTESKALQDVLATQPTAIAIGISEGSALALCGDGKIELWGEKQVTISLGRNYHD